MMRFVSLTSVSRQWYRSCELQVPVPLCFLKGFFLSFESFPHSLHVLSGPRKIFVVLSLGCSSSQVLCLGKLPIFVSPISIFLSSQSIHQYQTTFHCHKLPPTAGWHNLWGHTIASHVSEIVD
jgi:hypothetical protein